MVVQHPPMLGLSIAAALLAAWGTVTTANAAEQQYAAPFVLTSTTFQDGGLVPLRMAFTKDANNPDCLGENISPQLAWAGVRPGVRSFAITMFEMEDPPHTDLVIYGIPATVTMFAEGELSKPSAKFVGGKNYRNLSTWRGMCPPPHEGPYRTAIHHYQFTIWGTDLDPMELLPGLTADAVQEKLNGHIKGKALLIARFQRPE
jgi:phosphatidylethanolamine-binding protein (PEBP) family uncharacterized protein